MNPRAFIPNADTIIDALNEYGPKALLYSAIAFPIKALHTICKDGIVTAQEAHSKINLAAVCTTAAGWLDFATTAYRSYKTAKNFEITRRQHYPLGLSGKIGVGLFTAAGAAGAVGLQKSGAPGEELTSFAFVAASGALAATASIFVRKEVADLMSGKIQPIAAPAGDEGLDASAPLAVNERTPSINRNRAYQAA